MSTHTFAKTHNLITFLEKPTESDRFEQIVDFLNANPIMYALTVSPTIYTSCIKQFWTFTKGKTVNEDVRLQALVDGKKVILNEASIRRDLRLDDAEGTACLPNAAIFEDWQEWGIKNHLKSLLPIKLYFLLNGNFLFIPFCNDLVLKLLSGMNSTALWRLQSSSWPIIKNSTFPSTLDNTVKNLEAGVKFYMFPRFVQVFVNHQLGDMSHHKGNFVNPSLTKKGRIAEIDADEDLSLINETAQDQGRMNDQDMFGVNDFDGDEVVLDVSTGEKEEQSEKVAKTADVEVSAALTTTITIDDELTLAQTLVGIKAAKPKALTTTATTVTAISIRPKEKGIIMQEPSETPSPKPIVSSQQPSQPKDKGKAKMVEPVRPLKRKEQIMLDEEVARKLEAQMKAKMEEEERITREKDKANIVVIEEWDDVKATINADRQAGGKVEQEITKKQRLEKEDDTAELTRCMKIVPEDDDEVKIKATPLSSKSPTIVNYKIYKEGKKSYFKIIRADGNSQNYLTFGIMFKNFNREDLEVLRSIVKTRFKKTKPVNDMDNLLFQTLKTMFEHQVEDNIWKYQQGAVKVYNWKLLDSFGAAGIQGYYCLQQKLMLPSSRVITANRVSIAGWIKTEMA
nr:hypothetical protein [Tanacetum cinerariifolium]